MDKYSEVVILIAEDDDGHAELIEEHLTEAGVDNEIKRFKNGEEVWRFLSCEGEGEIRDNNKSYMLLLDIKMPKMDGIEVLRKIKSKNEIKYIPVIMLTTTDSPEEIQECYEIGCNAYITKPVSFVKFAETLRSIGLFINIVKVAKI